MMEFVDTIGAGVPKMGLGTWKMRGRGCRRSVLSALDMGYRHIDTAEFYRNEKEVGQALRESSVDRGELFLTTKAWSNHLKEEAIQRACEDSLRRLDVEYVDLYLIHHPTDKVPLEETLAGMQKLIEDGKTRFIGVSNFGVSRLDRALSIAEEPIFTNQVAFHPYRPQKELLAYCQDRGLMLTAYSPLARGGVTRNKTLRRIGERYKKSAAQVSLRWVVQREGVIAIPKASSPEHQRSNLEIFDFKLSADEVKKIDALG